MRPADFPQANTLFGSPKDLQGSCKQIHGFTQEVCGGIWDGSLQVIVAWKPSSEDIAKIVEGSPIFLATMGSLPPHRLCMDFEELIR